MTMDTADISELIPFERLIKGDARHDAYEGRVNTDSIQRELVVMRLSPKLPERATHLLGLSKQLCVAGFFFYDLYSVAIHHAAVAAEVAIRERFISTLPDRVTLTKASATRTFDRPLPTDLFVEALRAGWRLPSQEKNFVAGFRQLVRWAETQGIISGEEVGWWNVTNTLRTMYAHGSDSIVPPNTPIGVLRRTVWMLNELFPDADTLAHDRPRRAAADEATVRKHAEWRRLMKSGKDGTGGGV